MPHCFSKGFRVLQRVNRDTGVSFIDDGAMKSLAEMMGPALAGLARRTGSAAALQPIWAQVVGPVIAPHATPARFEGATLVIRCDAEAWRAALSAEGATLTRRLNAALTEAPVQALVFEVS